MDGEERVIVKKINGTIVSIPEEHKTYLISDDNKVMSLPETAAVTVKAQEIAQAPPITTSGTIPAGATTVSPGTVPPIEPRYPTAAPQPFSLGSLIPPGPAPLSGWTPEDWAKIDAVAGKLTEHLFPHLTPEQKAANRAKLKAELMSLGHAAKETVSRLWESFQKPKKKGIEEVVPERQTIISESQMADWEKKLMEEVK